MIRKVDCTFVFEWETPLVCPDKVKTLGCSVIDEQLHYTFNLTSLSGRSFEVMPSCGVTFIYNFIYLFIIAYCYQYFKTVGRVSLKHSV